MLETTYNIILVVLGSPLAHGPQLILLPVRHTKLHGPLSAAKLVYKLLKVLLLLLGMQRISLLELLR